MIIKFAEDSYIDVESIQFITGSYGSREPKNWKTDIVVNGVPITIEGQPGKNIMDAYIWQRRHALYDMLPDSPKYKQKLF